MSQCDLFADEVDVDLDVLHVTVMDRISGQVDRADIVVVNNYCSSNRDVELL